MIIIWHQVKQSHKAMVINDAESMKKAEKIILSQLISIKQKKVKNIFCLLKNNYHFCDT